MKKKLLTATLLLTSLVGLVSCGDEAPTTTQSTTNTIPSTEASTTPSTENTSTSTTNTIKPTTEPFNIYLAGDSTVQGYTDDQYIAGWGQYLDLFTSSNATVINCAKGGRSSRSFINEGRLYDTGSYTFSENGGNSIADGIKAGDYLFVQFGHNDDASKPGDYVYSLYDRMVPLGEPDSNGIYPITAGTKVPTTSLPEAYLNATGVTQDRITKGLTEIAKYGSEYYSYDCGGTYKWYLKQYIDFAREKGATPVLVTPVARLKFSGNTIISGPGLHGENFAYVKAVRQLAEEENCLLVDLFEESKSIFEAAGPQYATFLMAHKPNSLQGSWPVGYDKAYQNTEIGWESMEATHYNKYGSYLLAAAMAKNINSLFGTTAKAETITFKCNTTPSTYIDPSNLMSKSSISSTEALFTDITVTNPNRTYPSPQPVIDAITEKLVGEVTKDNYEEYKVKVSECDELYSLLNADDKPAVTNASKIQEYLDAIEAIELSLRPTPVRVVTYTFGTEAKSIPSASIELNGLTLFAGSSDMAIALNKVTFEYAGNSYEAPSCLQLKGSANFSTKRYIEFSVDGACTLTVYSKSGSPSDDRTLKVVNSSGNTEVGTLAAPGAGAVESINLEAAGSYKIGSSGSGINVYMIIIEYFA